MKINNILIFLLTICILTSAFVFTVSAEEINTISGKWELIDAPTTLNYSGSQDHLENVTFSSNGETFSTFSIAKLNTSNYRYYLMFDNTKVYRYHFEEVGYINEDYRVVDFGNTPQEVTYVFKNWLINNAKPLSCDGSTCPATDMNADNICDDCGMTLSLRLTGYPELPYVSGMFKNSVLLQREEGYFYMALTSDTPYSISGSVSDKYYITVADEKEVSYVTYWCTDGENWVHTYSGKAYSMSVGDSSATLLDSTFNWYKGGELFFQVPLWKEIQGVTQGELTQTTLPKTVGTMKTLVVCGVGLMACLVALSLFGKVLGLYRKR